VDIEQKTGLILSGGGARAAGRAGVLQAISRILRDAGWPAARNPFAIVCGTSAGAIHATGLACRADDFADAAEGLRETWNRGAVAQVYRADSITVLCPGARWLSRLSSGWLLRKWHAAPPNSLLDDTPLAGATEARGAALASCLPFEAGSTHEPMALGRQDTDARRGDVLAFFES